MRLNLGLWNRYYRTPDAPAAVRCRCCSEIVPADRVVQTVEADRIKSKWACHACVIAKSANYDGEYDVVLGRPRS